MPGLTPSGARPLPPLSLPRGCPCSLRRTRLARLPGFPYTQSIEPYIVRIEIVYVPFLLGGGAQAMRGIGKASSTRRGRFINDRRRSLRPAGQRQAPLVMLLLTGRAIAWPERGHHCANPS